MGYRYRQGRPPRYADLRGVGRGYWRNHWSMTRHPYREEDRGTGCQRHSDTHECLLPNSPQKYWSSGRTLQLISLTSRDHSLKNENITSGFMENCSVNIISNLKGLLLFWTSNGFLYSSGFTSCKCRNVCL